MIDLLLVVAIGTNLATILYCRACVAGWRARLAPSANLTAEDVFAAAKEADTVEDFKLRLLRRSGVGPWGPRL